MPLLGLGHHRIFGGDLGEKMSKIVRNGSGDPTLKIGRIGSTAESWAVYHCWDGVTIIFGGDMSEKTAKIVRNGSGDRTLKIGRTGSTAES